MAVIDFRHRPKAQGFGEILSADTSKKTKHTKTSRLQTGRIRNMLRFITHTSLCLLVAIGSYQAYLLAQKAQLNLMVLLP